MRPLVGGLAGGEAGVVGPVWRAEPRSGSSVPGPVVPPTWLESCDVSTEISATQPTAATTTAAMAIRTRFTRGPAPAAHERA